MVKVDGQNEVRSATPASVLRSVVTNERAQALKPGSEAEGLLD